LSILLLEYSFTGDLERASALGLLITLMICVMMLVGRRFGLHLAKTERSVDDPAGAGGPVPK
jgi:ABC-type Fe3+ transport system permease subunit